MLSSKTFTRRVWQAICFKIRWLYLIRSINHLIQSFDTVGKLFDAFDKSFDMFDKSFDAFDKPFDAFNKLFDTFDKSFDTFDKLFDAFNKSFDAFDESFDAFDKLFDAFDKLYDAGCKLQGKVALRHNVYCACAMPPSVNLDVERACRQPRRLQSETAISQVIFKQQSTFVYNCKYLQCTVSKLESIWPLFNVCYL